MKSLYLECNAGISGDMLVAALLDVGADRKALEQALSTIPAHGFTYKISRVSKAGVDCCDFDVVLDAKHENHDHDMAFLHGEGQHHHDHDELCHEAFYVQEHEHTHAHHHDHEEHDHDHHHDEHVPHEHHHHHEHRGLPEIINIIQQVEMTEKARATALRIFDIVAEAESKAHAVPKEQVHFHEVGAIDSIVDIVAIAVCLDSLEVDAVIVPVLCEGQGTIRCQHGILPVPVPATANIMRDYKLKVRILPVEGEFVTPTGAAAVAAIKTTDVLPADFTIAAVGLGAGKRTYERPSILRALLIEHGAQGSATQVCKLEANIDDCSGEVLGYAMERLLAAGALDVQILPAYMKKQRPAWQLQVLCQVEAREAMEKIIFAETTTIGIRHCLMERTVLPRRAGVVETAYGPVAVKTVVTPVGERTYVEYDSAAAVAAAKNVPLQTVYAAAEGIVKE